MKVHIHLNVDHEKKILFESLKIIHGKTFSDILEEGLNACLSEIAPSKLIEEEIAQTKMKLMELEQNLMTVRMIEKQQKIEQKATEQKEDIVEGYLETMRVERFEEFKDSTIKLWKKGDMNWPRIVDLYQFKSTSEAKEWFARKMAEVEA
jgi:myo-inositol-1-phosphate synthase